MKLITEIFTLQVGKRDHYLCHCADMSELASYDHSNTHAIYYFILENVLNSQVNFNTENFRHNMIMTRGKKFI